MDPNEATGKLTVTLGDGITASLTSINAWPDLSTRANKTASACATISAKISDFLKEQNKEEVINNYFAIKKVIFNNPATIVYWADGTKTVVKRQKGDRWDKEKGLAMAIAKKALGNKGNYCNVLKKWTEEN